MRRRFWLGAARLVTLVIPLASALLAPTPAAAHPLGNFSVNRYSRLEVGRETVRLRYVLDLAEIPTLQELRAAGFDPASLDQTGRERLLAARTRELAASTRLEIDEKPVTWSVEASRLELVPGQADLPTLRIELTLAAPFTSPSGAGLLYRDTNYPGRAGWHEVVLRGVDGASLADSSVPAQDVTDELRQYPDDPTRAPLDRSAASATVQLGAVSGVADPFTLERSAASTSRFAVDRSPDQLVGFLRTGGSSNLLTLMAALAVAAGLGAMHALGPGHGKTVVGAYLVGSRGTARHAVFLGLTVTLTHTIGVYGLGLLTLVAAQYILPDQLYPILGVVSGLLVVAIGSSLLQSRLRGMVQGSDHHRRGGLAAHDDGHEPGHLHQPGHAPHDHGGGHAHHHLPPGADGQPVTMKSLLALGVSGGLLPCPSALVVLLAAVSFHNVVLGMTLVAAFSVGLSAVLTGIGLLMVYGGRWMSRSRLAPRLAASPLSRVVPALSAAAITLAGLFITAQAASAFL